MSESDGPINRSIPLRTLTTGRHLLGTVGWVLAAVALAAGNVQNIEPRAPAFFARADLVTLPVTVTDQRDEYVADLDAAQFQIFENGRRQPLEFFQSTAVPLKLTLVLDTSASMNSRLSAITEGAVEFTRDLDPDDVVSVIAFNERVRVMSEFTSSHDALEGAIRGAERGDSTSLYTAVYVALKELERADVGEPTMPRRRVLIVLSDGADNTSLMSFEDVLKTAAGTDAAIYAIRFEGSLPAMDPPSDALASCFGGSPNRLAVAPSFQSRQPTCSGRTRQSAPNWLTSTCWHTSRQTAHVQQGSISCP